MLWKRRKHLDKFGRKIGKLFSSMPLSPNNWTGLGLILVIITFYFLVNKDFLIATILFAFTALIDMRWFCGKAKQKGNKNRRFS